MSQPGTKSSSLGAVTSPASRHHDVEYATGLSLLGLTSGMPLLDSLIGGLKPDTMALITGPGISIQAAEGYCIRAQLPEARGGLNAGAYLIDAGNSFDVYLFTKLARKYRLGYDSALNRQLLARAFTIYELRALAEDAERVFASRRPRLLAISEVFAPFTEDVDRYEARRLFRDIVEAVSQLNEAQNVPVLLTSSKRHEALTPILEERCTVSADIEQREDRKTFRLLKHAWKAPTEVVREGHPRSHNYNQATLEMPRLS
jgi:hypothetical protein